MKKLALLAFTLCLVLAGCGKTESDESQKTETQTGQYPQSSANTDRQATTDTAQMTPATVDGEVFLNISFSDALEKAHDEKKLLLVDFYTDWCPPCKMLDRTTWKNPKVMSWLSANTVPLKINAEKELNLAEQYSIEAYPSILFINPDGTEKDRLVGYMRSDEFLSEAQAIIEGKDPVARAKEKLDRMQPNDPTGHQEYGEALAKAGRYQEALEEYLWCFDNGIQHNEDYAHYQMPDLMDDLKDLADDYPPALDAIRQRRDALYKAILDGTAIADSDGQPKEEGFWSAFRKNEFQPDPDFLSYEYMMINRAIDENEETVKLYKHMRETQPNSEWILPLSRVAVRLLLDEERYEEIAQNIDLNPMIDEVFDQFKYLIEDSENEELDAHFLDAFLSELIPYYRIFLKTGNDEEAQALAKRIIALNSAGKYCGTYNSLAWEDHEIGHVNETTLNWATKALDIIKSQLQPDQEHYAAIVDTYACILADLGRTKEAYTAVEEARQYLKLPAALEILDDTDARIAELTEKSI